MPWPWQIAFACLDLSNGQILNWPKPNKEFSENEFYLLAAFQVWRTWHLFNKPKTIKGANGKVVSNWTPNDVDYFAWLMEDA